MRRLAPAIVVLVGMAGLAQAQDKPAAITPAAVKWAEAAVDRELPAEAVALGHHGTVVLEGDVSAEGRMASVTVARSSSAPDLDALALRTFANARVGADLLAGKPQKVRLTVEYGSYDFDNMGLSYLCRQAVRDADWYAAAFPDQPVEHNRFKTYLQGMGLLNERMAFAKDRDRFEAAWRETIALCRDRPDASVLGLIALVGNRKALPK